MCFDEFKNETKNEISRAVQLLADAALEGALKRLGDFCTVLEGGGGDGGNTLSQRSDSDASYEDDRRSTTSTTSHGKGPLHSAC